MSHSFTISGNLVDIQNREIYPASILVTDTRIEKITRNGEKYDNYIMPGFVDSHVHIESSMLVPSEFARLAVVHGTVATVSDPHEIGNVLGVEGIRYMIANGRKVPFKFYFGAPSCVPATAFETAGAEITPEDIRRLFVDDGLKYLSEMMNYPGVLFSDPVVMEKISIARELGKPVDGHAPGLRGEDVKKYVWAGISTDHECFTLEEALEKVALGMKILIREGSAAKNYEALHPLIKLNPAMVMFCSDDKHPNDLVEGHINQLAARSIDKGYDLFDVLQIACVNPVKHYDLEVGLLREGDPADFIVVKDLTKFIVKQTYIEGNIVAVSGKSLVIPVKAAAINNFNAEFKRTEDFAVSAGNKNSPVNIRVIEALEGQLITKELHCPALLKDDNIISDTERDILKMAVVERYSNGKPAIAFIKNFGLKKGAIASCVAHDSHNIIAVGATDEDICNAVNAIIESKGGISVSSDGWTEVLPLPVAGIMTNEDGYLTAEKYTHIDRVAKELGTKLHAPFMTLSFMALLVIPQLKLSDKGLFDGKSFRLTELVLK
jgi:adenine deaminase